MSEPINQRESTQATDKQTAIKTYKIRIFKSLFLYLCLETLGKSGFSRSQTAHDLQRKQIVFGNKRRNFIVVPNGRVELVVQLLIYNEYLKAIGIK